MRFRPLCTVSSLLVVAILAGCANPSAPATTGTEGGAIMVPLMASQPVLDDDLQTHEWAEAHLINGQFHIADGTRAEGTYPFTIRVGVTADALHLGVLLPDFPENPWNSATATHSDCVIFFFTEDAPTISKPSFTVGGCAGVAGYSTTHPGYWNGREWVIDENPESGKFNGGRPTAGTWARGNVRDGTLFFEVYTPRFPTDTEHNGLNLEDGTTFRMSILFMRLGDGGEESASPDARGSFSGPHDAFPGDGYTPNGQYDATGWLRLTLPAGHPATPATAV